MFLITGRAVPPVETQSPPLPKKRKSALTGAWARTARPLSASAKMPPETTPSTTACARHFARSSQAAGRRASLSPALRRLSCQHNAQRPDQVPNKSGGQSALMRRVLRGRASPLCRHPWRRLRVSRSRNTGLALRVVKNLKRGTRGAAGKTPAAPTNTSPNPVENLWKTGGKPNPPLHFSPNFQQLFHNFSTTFPQPKISPKSAHHYTLTCPLLVKSLDTTITTCYINHEV